MSSTEILRKYNLRSTACRNEVLDMFLQHDQALSNGDIEKDISDSIDRVTVYRTLKTFLEKGLIHKVLDDTGGAKYALCQECSVHQHNHEHVHFKCSKCHETHCLDVGIPAVKLPHGFKAEERNLLIQGLCQQCNS